MITLPSGPAASTPPPGESPLVPAAWCRRILTSLNKRKLSERSAGNLEMLLTYFIELNLSAEAFVKKLGEYSGGTRVDMAHAATMLLRAWEEGHGELGGGPLPLQETLRTLGARLDDASAHAAYLTVTPENVQLQTFGDLSECSLDHMELRLEVASRLALRGQVKAQDPGVPLRYETRLRVIGARLEHEPPQAYEFFVTPRTIVVEGSEGFYRSLPLDELIAELPPALRPQ